MRCLTAIRKSHRLDTLGGFPIFLSPAKKRCDRSIWRYNVHRDEKLRAEKYPRSHGLEFDCNNRGAGRSIHAAVIPIRN